MKKRGPFADQLFTAAEKRDLAGATFRATVLDGADFSKANLQLATFEQMSLKGCDFRGADLRGAQFLRCDLSEAHLDEVMLGGNRFHGSTLVGATGLTEEQVDYVGRRGGSFAAEERPGGHLRLIK